MSLINDGDEVLLFLDPKRTYKVRVENSKQFHTHKGFIDLGELVGKPFGSKITSSLGNSFFSLKPLIRDRVLKTDRRTQVLYPKDIGYILFQLDVSSGKRVVEAGTGSGALTMALANAIRPNGIVFSYDIHEKHQQIAKGNINRADLMPFVNLKLADITQGIFEEDIDAVVLDLATPWAVVSHAWNALVGSGMFLAFSPTIEQTIKTVEELRKHPFIEIDTVELLMRNINVGVNRTRPRTQMVGHSGYLTTARKVFQ